jgi:hypothetical protein
MQSRFVIVNEDAGGDVHGITEQQSFSDTTLAQTFFNLRRDVDQLPTCRRLKPEFFAIAFY